MGYAEGNTHGFDRADMANETWLFRILDCGDFSNSEEMIDFLRSAGYHSFVAHILPFIELEVYADEVYGLKSVLNEHGVYFLIF